MAVVDSFRLRAMKGDQNRSEPAANAIATTVGKQAERKGRSGSFVPATATSVRGIWRSHLGVVSRTVSLVIIVVVGLWVVVVGRVWQFLGGGGDPSDGFGHDRGCVDERYA